MNNVSMTIHHPVQRSESRVPYNRYFRQNPTIRHGLALHEIPAFRAKLPREVSDLNRSGRATGVRVNVYGTSQGDLVVV